MLRKETLLWWLERCKIRPGTASEKLPARGAGACRCPGRGAGVSQKCGPSILSLF